MSTWRLSDRTLPRRGLQWGGAVVGPLLLAISTSALVASECCDTASPFREGEGLADVPATCANIAGWAQKAPKTSARITLAIKGRLSKVESNAVVVYLTMCDAPQMQVFCVTYETNGMKAGDIVTFAGGYERSQTGQVVLDPCLASRG